MRLAPFVALMHGPALVAHGILALGLTRFVSWPVAAASALAMWAGTALRMGTLLRDWRRPSWVVRLVDEPVFLHWGACLFAAPPFVAGAMLVLALHWGAGVPRLAMPALASLGLGSYALGVAIAGWGIWVERRRLRIRRITLAVRNLPQAFDGYRIVQLSDLHIGSYDGVARGLEWAAAANALGADLAVVTGDLVTDGVAFYEDAAAVVGSLSAPDGVCVSMGNHDQRDNDALTARIEARGPRVLRNAWLSVRRGTSELVVAGLGDRFTRRDDMDATLSGRPAGAPTVLLAHYPVSFDAAADRGVDVVLSGHTHGGQVGLPFFGERVNVASLTGQHRRGVYRRGASSLYVNAGLGTTGPPIRVGVAPEIALIVLERSLAEERE